ncbi:MAG: hypothetical protein ACXITR_07485 [Cyanobacterium sp.]
MKIIKYLGLLIGTGTIFNLSIVKPIYGQQLSQSSSHNSPISSTIISSDNVNQNLIITQSNSTNTGINNQNQTSGYVYPSRRPETIIIILPNDNNGSIDFFNGNLRRNSNYWRNNNINQPRNNSSSITINSRSVNSINVNPINFNNVGVSRIEKRCVHKQFQTIWANVHCSMNSPSFEWRNVYVD